MAVRGDTKGSVKPETAGKRGRSEGANGTKTRAKSDKGTVGTSLRTVYQETVNEDIPSELLDLLGKLS